MGVPGGSTRSARGCYCLHRCKFSSEKSRVPTLLTRRFHAQGDQREKSRRRPSKSGSIRRWPLQPVCVFSPSGSKKKMPRKALTLRLENDRDWQVALREIPPELRKTGLRDALRRASRALVNRIKGYVPVDKNAKPSGTLKKSMGLVVRRSRRRDGDPYAVIGARRGFKREVVRNGRAELADPANYAHLVEYGHAIVHGGTLYDASRGSSQRKSRVEGRTGRGQVGATRVAAQPFMRPGIQSGRGETLSVLATSLRNWVKVVAERARKKAERKALLK
jgi:hypothetical protein